MYYIYIFEILIFTYLSIYYILYIYTHLYIYTYICAVYMYIHTCLFVFLLLIYIQSITCTVLTFFLKFISISSSVTSLFPSCACCTSSSSYFTSCEALFDTSCGSCSQPYVFLFIFFYFHFCLNCSRHSRFPSMSDILFFPDDKSFKPVWLSVGRFVVISCNQH